MHFNDFELLKKSSPFGLPTNKGIAMSELTKAMLETIDQKIGDKSFYSVKELVTVGVFGSLVSARRALKKGCLPYIRVSQRRFVVLRPALLHFLQNNFAEKQD